MMMQRWVVRGAHRFELPGAQPGRDHLGGRLIWDMHLKRWLDEFLETIFGQPARAAEVASVRAPSQVPDAPASSGNRQAQMPATATAPTPPNTTAGTVPISAAIVPARNSPSSLERRRRPC